jgi:hypothetical protein
MSPVNEGFGSASQDAPSAIAKIARLSSQQFFQGAAVSRPPKKGRRFGNRRSLRLTLRSVRVVMSDFFTFRNPVSGIRNYFVTLIFPPSPRAFTLRSYIDSAKTGGTTKFPRLHDLI